MSSNFETSIGCETVEGRPNGVELAAGSPAQASAPVHVALVDDEAGVHQFLREVFKRFARNWILDSYMDGPGAVRHVPESPPKVVLMDLCLPGMSGLTCARELKARLPALPILMFSAHMDRETLMDCMLAGAGGCFYKPAEPQHLVAALQKTMSGSLTLCPKAEKALMECFHIWGRKFHDLQFTRREQEILDCIRQDKSDREIAEKLNIQSGTVHVHLANIFKKLNVHSRAEAVRAILNL
jgi:DNA-binding NarL/FixJ family response regulator